MQHGAYKANVMQIVLHVRSSLLDGDLASQVDVEDIQTLQFMQWTTPQFCAAILEKLLPCLKTPDERFVLHAYELLHQVAAMLRESVIQATLWDDGSLPARELVSWKLLCYEKLVVSSMADHFAGITPGQRPAALMH